MYTAWFIAIAAAAVALAAVAVLWIARGRRPSDAGETVDHWDPQTVRVLSTGERRAYRLLRQALPEEHVLAKLPLVRFIKMPRRDTQTRWLRQVGRLTADFVVCDDDFEVLAVVSLNPSHAAAPRSARSVKRRERARRVLQSAGVPLHIWNIDTLPGIAEAREAITSGQGTSFDREEWLAPPTRPEPRSSRPPRSSLAATPVQRAAEMQWQPVPLAPAVRARFTPAADELDSLPTLTSSVDGYGYAHTVGLTAEEIIEVREPPASTWFDYFDDDGGLRPTPGRRSSDRSPGPDARKLR